MKRRFLYPRRLKEISPPDSTLGRALAAAQSRHPGGDEGAAVERRLFAALGAAVIASPSIGVASPAGASTGLVAAASPVVSLKVGVALAAVLAAAGGGAVAWRARRAAAGDPTRIEASAGRNAGVVDRPQPGSVDPPPVVSRSASQSLASARPSGRSQPTSAIDVGRRRRATATDPVRAELRLIEGARAVVGTEPARALSLCVEHQRLFPQGVMREEREAVFIAALASLGRLEEARTRRASFLSTYPGSPYAGGLRDRLGATVGP